MTNVELTSARRAYLLKRLLSLGKYVVDPKMMHIDLVMRAHRHPYSRKQYYVSIKLSTTSRSFITVAIGTRFKATISEACRVLQRQLSEGPLPSRSLGYVVKDLVS